MMCSGPKQANFIHSNVRWFSEACVQQQANVIHSIMQFLNNSDI